MQAVHGVFALAKPKGPSSNQILTLLKAILRKRGHDIKNTKMGHGGTLDPYATGVLVVGLGRGCRQLQRFLDGPKEYKTTALLGAETNTQDGDTDTITRTAPFGHVTREMIENVLPKYRGRIQQTPPMFSALKQNGKPLYHYAHNNERPPFEVEPRNVEVYELELLDFLRSHPFHHPTNYPPKSDNLLKDGNLLTRYLREPLDPSLPPPAPAFEMRMRTSAGFYVRTIMQDIARDLDSAAHVVSLARTHQGVFGPEQCLTIEEVAGEDGDERILQAIEESKTRIEGYDVLDKKEEAKKRVRSGWVHKGSSRRSEREREREPRRSSEVEDPFSSMEWM